MKKIIMLFLLTSILLADAAKSNKKGVEYFQQENYEAALTDFRDAQLEDKKSPIIAHNIGSALYQQKRYDKTIEEMSKVLTETQDSTVLSQLYYNLGNGFFRQDSLLKSIEMYKKALQYRPVDQDAKFNLELARALLKDQSEQQDQQKQDQNQEQNQKQNQENQEDQENQEEEQNKQDEQQDEQEQQEQQQQEKKPEEMTEEETRNLLKALEDKEKDQQEERLTGRPGRGSGKDW